MTIHTPICDLLGIEYPNLCSRSGDGACRFVCGAMCRRFERGAHSGRWEWRGARTAKSARRSRQVCDLTDKPFGVDLLAAGSGELLERTADAIIEGGAKAFISVSGARRRRIW